MSYKPDEKEWMAYLYDELDEEERRAFEEYLLRNPVAQEELSRLRDLREMLSSVADQEIIAPPIVTGAAPLRAKRTGIRLVMAVAASLILVILVGKFAGLRLTITDQSLTLSFGGEIQPQPPSLTAYDVQHMIDSSLDRNNQFVQASLVETQKELEASIRKNLAASSAQVRELVGQASTASQEDIREFASTLREQNMQQVQEYFQLTSTEQKQYIENLLVDFAKYLQQQRTNDFQVMQLRLNSLEQNTVAFKQETEQILASIITTVAGPLPDERRN